MKLRFIFFTLFLATLISGCTRDPFEEDNSGTFSDSRDGRLYDWVRIGTQIWMADNLGYLPAVSPPATLSETAPNYYVLNYSGTSVSEAKAGTSYAAYGALYNWTAARTACPSGWHLPSDTEWTVLTDYLGGAATAGMKMKSTTGWVDNGNGDNSSGFNAFPAGALDHKYGFGALTYLATFSSDTENSATTSWYRGLSFHEDKVNRNNTMKSDAYSVRCIRN
jgi:uncharacterized protein (TIGR02145 family)